MARAYDSASRSAPGVEALEARELTNAASVLARAFRDNPGITAMLGTKNPERRLSLLERLTPVLTRAYRDHAEAWIVRAPDGTIAGVALTAAPDGYPPRPAMELQIAWDVMRALPLVTTARLGVSDAILRHYHMQGRHHYLFMLGVSPERQGQGYGGALLRALSTRANDGRLPCYLETDKLSSVRLYERHGYVVTRQRTFPGLPDLTLWCMRREPR